MCPIYGCESIFWPNLHKKSGGLQSVSKFKTCTRIKIYDVWIILCLMKKVPWFLR